MKTKLSILLTYVFFLISICGAAQVIDPKKEVEKESTKRANQKIDKGIDKGLDKIEEGIGSLFGKKKKKNKKEANEPQQEQTINTQTQETTTAGPNLNWSKYDFIPGDHVIFEDNLAGEENGEFPSRWDLFKGTVEIASFGGENVIMFRKGASAIIPFIQNSDKDYLPDIFTIEMDLYFDAPTQNVYSLTLHDLKNQNGSALNRIECLPGGLKGFHSEEAYSGMGLWDKTQKSQWRHISLGFNTRALKAYFDDERLINIPNLGFNPTGLTIEIINATNPTHYFVKNIRIASGGQKLYDKYLQDGRIVANGIRFEVNEAKLLPESMGVINEMVELMKEHPEINFIVEGHTDSDGDETSNMKLSDNRARTVVRVMLVKGIKASRLEPKGMGEGKPMDTNDTPEGKANNRRVEFVKK